MLSSILAAFATFATLSAAFPHNHAHLHSHKNLHIRHSSQALARTDKLASLAGRTVSLDGSCGSWSGSTCRVGYCCAADGWCGNSTQHCGPGCQTAFGECAAHSGAVRDAKAAVYSPPSTSSPAYNTTSASAAPSGGALKISPNGLCGPDYAFTCMNSNFGSACSKWGYCGSNSSYSGQGCQTAYGSCSGSSHAPSRPASTTIITSAYSALAYSAPAQSSPAETSPATAPAASSSEAPAPSSTSSSSSGSSASDTYKMYTGNGLLGWPTQSQWASFDALWSTNLPVISISCAQFGQANNSPQESSDVKSALLSVASSTGVDARFILAIMMQESKGCVRAPTTNYGVVNPGLMQSHAGAGSCNNGVVQDPCPQSQIQQMLQDGAGGTSQGDGLKQTLSRAACADVSKYYKAARIYNSGSVAASGDLGAGIATHCYASDIANRLTGWVSATRSCTLDG